MNTIISYLDTMFSAYPQSPRLREAKAELQGMMEDAYASLIAQGHSENEAVGQVIRDFGNLAEVAPELGITAELGGPAAASAAAAPQGPTAPGIPVRPEPAGPHAVAATPRHSPITLQEATGFADAQHRIRYRVAIAVALFVLSPITLILLPAIAAAGVVPLTGGTASTLGIFALLACVAGGVMTLLSTGRELAPYRRIEQGHFSPTVAVSQWADELALREQPARARGLQIAVLLWILSPTPLLAFAFLDDRTPHKQLWVLVGVAGVLAFVAAGLLVLIPAAWAQSVAERLSLGHAGGAATAASVDGGEHSVIGVIAALYWPLLTAVYLGWSFIGNAWGESWIVWPVGAVLFGAIAAGGGAWESYRKNRQHRGIS